MMNYLIKLVQYAMPYMPVIIIISNGNRQQYSIMTAVRVHIVRSVKLDCTTKYLVRL